MSAKRRSPGRSGAPRPSGSMGNMGNLAKQIQQMQGMGSMSKLMEMLPFGAKVPKDLVDLQEEKVKKFKFIIDSMTEEEKESPELIKSERVERIAAGSGTKTEDVKELLNYFKRMKKLMKGAGSQRSLDRMMKKMGLNM